MGKDVSVQEVQATPEFDLELYMMMNQSKRMDGETVNEAAETWDRLADHLHVATISGGGAKGWLLTWLDKTVEEEVNALWESNPSKAFAINTVGQTLLMAAIRDQVPEVTAAGCAPVPRPNPILKKGLKQAGVEWLADGSLSLQYAMLTNSPFIGGCDVCQLQETCPKLSMARSAQGEGR